MTDRPGWYADPSGRNETYRWWDGASWTRWLSETGDAPEPDEEAELAAAAPNGGDAYITDASDDDQPTIRLPLAVGITIGTLVLCLVVVGFAVSISSDRLPSGPAIDPPPKAEQEIVALYDEVAQEYIAGPVRMKLPGAPYACSDYPTTLRSGAENGFDCNVAVHPDYRDGRSWSADTGFGVLPDSMIVPGDLLATSGKVLDQLGTNGYEGVKLIDPEFKAEKVEGVTNPPDEAIRVTGTMGYRVPGLPATRTYLSFIVIKLAESGKHVVFYSDYPDTAAKSVPAAQDAAIKTLTAR